MNHERDNIRRYRFRSIDLGDCIKLYSKQGRIGFQLFAQSVAAILGIGLLTWHILVYRTLCIAPALSCIRKFCIAGICLFLSSLVFLGVVTHRVVDQQSTLSIRCIYHVIEEHQSVVLSALVSRVYPLLRYSVSP